MNQLFIFVEGSDDERFFRHFFPEKNVKIIQYAHMSHQDFRKMIQSTCYIDNADYIVITDADGATVEDKKNKFVDRHPHCDRNKLFVSQREIESWYLAGLNREETLKRKIKYIPNTNEVSKEQFEQLVPKGYSLIHFKREILEIYDFCEARKRNESFNQFYTSNKNGMSLD